MQIGRLICCLLAIALRSHELYVIPIHLAYIDVTRLSVKNNKTSRSRMPYGSKCSTMHLRDFLPKHPDGEGRLSPKWPKSPRSPKSPKSPKPLTFTELNFDRLHQCMGCNKVEDLIRWNIEQRKLRKERVPSTNLHKNFHELEQCASKCATCRVFRQSLLLEKVTFDEVESVKSTQGEVTVQWQEITTANNQPGILLKVGIEDAHGLTGVVSCNSHDEVTHLALHPHGSYPGVIEQAKAWLNVCRSDHVGRCDNLKYSSENPQLLIEILSPEHIQLRPNLSGRCEYVALSYCWGPKNLPEIEKAEVNRGMTVNENLEERCIHPFPISELPTTVRDALFIIREMGIRYAWIDTLCINQTTGEGFKTMHKVYSNALFTLCACATTKATAKLLDWREAWTKRTEPCRLGGQWLTTTDMSLKELRLRSPLEKRAWTLQEERLSPRMLYVSSSRFYWSCATTQEMELKPENSPKSTRQQRPVYAAPEDNTRIPNSQEFLLACRSGLSNLHVFWADIVKSYALRDLSDPGDRLKALAGLAAKYLSANPLDEYLAGIWANNLSEGLAWKVKEAVHIDGKVVVAMTPGWPSWSWAALPKQTAVETDVKSARSQFFDWIPDNNATKSGAHIDVGTAIEEGQSVTELTVTGRVRFLWKSSSNHVPWAQVSRAANGEERFTFAERPEQDVHAVDPVSGRVMVYEDRKQEVVGQLDYRYDVERVQSGHLELLGLEVGETSILLLEKLDDGTHRRVGAAWDVRRDFFKLVREERKLLVLR